MQQALQELVSNGIPGVSLAVYSPDGWWASAAGLAKIEDNTLMQPCHLQYTQSVSKTYMAVAVLKLVEQGKISLGDPITKHLPARYSRYITSADKITVQMLLNHTSGIPEYNFTPAYVTYFLQHPTHYFSAEDYLKYIEGKDLDFTPGSKYSYRNTNYVILSLMADAITGDHAKFITETIITPLGLTQTFYRNQSGYPNYPHITNSYWDRYSNGIVENISQMQLTNVASMVGDDGIVVSPGDAVKFLRGLMEGKLLSAATMEKMQTWVLNSKGEPAYGLGLAHAKVNGYTAYGHSGGGIGAGCQLYYFPEKNLYMYIAINLGTVTNSPLHQHVGTTLDTIFTALLK
ncbi:beta-lactamase family protein [Rhodocytophaga rosea]|uniref:Beta-lactamase family protein n=2 Tax=Rhodocytophaga rosea TaxID=2704465 RepID=A0A6C0GVW7_9BACT|nr:beta-lactamase family protein [Rhodocytophaga rosea]